jgi:hypothetical protein
MKLKLKKLMITPPIIDGMYLIHFFFVVGMNLQVRNIGLNTSHMFHVID